jgi:hypothetical protein
MQVAGRRGRRLGRDDLNKRWRHAHLKKKALDRKMWRARFGRVFAPVVRQTAKWTNYYIQGNEF